MDRTAAFYSAPSYGHSGGGGLPRFMGARRRIGGGILGSIAKLAMPVLKSVARRAGRQALGLGLDVAGDVLRGRNVTQSLVRHGKRRAINLGKGVLQTGLSHFGAAPSGKASISRKTSSIRKRSRSVATRGRPAKRRRARHD